MNEDSERIRRGIIAMVKSAIPSSVVWAKVKSVSDKKCTVTIDDLDVENILLGFDGSGVVVKPKVGSDVLILLVANTKTVGVVVCVRQTESIEIMGNENGGFINIEPLVTIITDLQTQLNAFKTVLNTWVPVPNDGGAALKAAAGTFASDSITLTVRSDIENTKINHGNG